MPILLSATILMLAAIVSAAPRPPNIVLIMADDLGYETIGANGGNSYRTPRLDQLARQGMRFDHCYSQPLCTPTRVQLMTGQYNVRNYVEFGYLDIHQPSFARILKAGGYKTCIAGKWQLNGKVETNGFPAADRARYFGFDQWCLWQTTESGRIRVNGKQVDARYANPVLNINGKHTKPLTDRFGPDLCVEFILNFITESRDAPFMVYYPMILTHCPFWPTPDSAEWTNPANRMPGDAYKGAPQHFGDMVAYMDKIVGRIVDRIDELGLGRDTIILFTGDNGTDSPIKSICNGVEVAGRKGSTTNGGTHVPLIARWPGGGGRPGRVSQDLIDFSDFLPTLLEAAGVPPPAGFPLDGRSFLPQLKGKPGSPRQWIYCWYSRNGETEKARVFARTERYKLYTDGKFYDVEEDSEEKQPLARESLSPAAATAHTLLEGALAQYAGIR